VAVTPILFFRIQLVVCDLGLRMRVVIVAPIRLPGDGLARCLHGRADDEILRVVTNIAEARALLSTTHIVSREATIEGLTNAMHNAVAGRLACPDEISGGLLRTLFRQEPEEKQDVEPLTKREGDVLQLIRQGLTNKEIARELGLSVAAVKHHVHNLLEKLRLPRRAHAMRRVRSQERIVVASRL